ncbi:RsfA family transcriptional regulator [Aquibacillus rhizosphaerae]|uniref:RsfA family transcriptional regulator n=1 Tax=Aquibacillus rhizosphaerae TaxID=3051431 RepID=A0ABT7L6F9_9BACI|nr:RsfA family transcriptional regulator [Aquibacillus sp. LR5S19]MDL4841442.1 RsfA family transcriptional regulator [Aquibacillus sp. LR5S19]
MVKVRQDAWSHEDDLLLAETVLRHIREGSTQLNAFEEVGDKLNRTSAACGFRWNAEVRQRYDQAVAIAKRQRKEKKRAIARQEKSTLRQTPVVTPTELDANIIEQEQFSFSNEIESNNDHTISTTSLDSMINLDSVIDYLKSIKKDFNESTRSKSSLEKLKQENETLLNEKQNLENKVVKLQKQVTTVQEDYQVLIQIMDRARKMVVFDEDNNISTPAFRMEKNGNLEHVAR